MTVQKLYEKAMELESFDRELLADRLLHSLQPRDGEEFTDEFKAELDRLIDEDDRHPERGISWEELRAKLTASRKPVTALSAR